MQGLQFLSLPILFKYIRLILAYKRFTLVLKVAMSLFKYFCNVSSKEFDAAPASSSTNEVNLAKHRKTELKRQKWNDSYLNYGFCRPISEEKNFYINAQCLFCSTIYGNVNLVPSKLISHLKKQHPEQQNKSEKFFQSHLAAQRKQSNLLDRQMRPQLIHNKKLLLASLKMSHHMMKVKRPHTELERVVLPCLEIADLIHGRKAVDKIKQIPLSDTTVRPQCAVISADLKQQLIRKILEAPSFGIQLDKSTDISSESQLMVFCRFPDVEANRIVEYYLFCHAVREKQLLKRFSTQ